ncbi:hypothetical protein BGZ63DRAFT_463148 [Mariannaea sp. PMI_226]|nr:hypothetical protein BGZ63DRAFT_463148 [Mariannaea sp. PMI_226]
MAFVNTTSYLEAPMQEWLADFQVNPTSLSSTSTIDPSNPKNELTSCDLSDGLFSLMPCSNFDLDSSITHSVINELIQPVWQHETYTTPTTVPLLDSPSPHTFADLATTNSCSPITPEPHTGATLFNSIKINYQHRQTSKCISPKNKGTTRLQNRISASKCRQKKKKQAQELEEKLQQLQSQQSSLQTKLNELREEAVQVRHLLMIHSSCNNREIDEWVKSKAANFVQGISP